ncbi:unnamed protein product [Closterium sp. NIES-54]
MPSPSPLKQTPTERAEAKFLEALSNYITKWLPQFDWLLLDKGDDGLPCLQCSLCSEHGPYDLRHVHLNRSHHLALLFPLLDTSPLDSHISQSELATWPLAVERAASLHTMRREMDSVDGDADGMITLDEALEDELADQASSPLTLFTVFVLLTVLTLVPC